jgi:hypothetical protein
MRKPLTTSPEKTWHTLMSDDRHTSVALSNANPICGRILRRPRQHSQARRPRLRNPALPSFQPVSLSAFQHFHSDLRFQRFTFCALAPTVTVQYRKERLRTLNNAQKHVPRTQSRSAAVSAASSGTGSVPGTGARKRPSWGTGGETPPALAGEPPAVRNPAATLFSACQPVSVSAFSFRSLVSAFCLLCASVPLW